MTAYFLIKTEAGQEFVGSVQGFGGQIGGGAAHISDEAERQSGLRILKACIESVNRSGRVHGLLEAREKPDHCYMRSVKDEQLPYSQYVKETVPLKGATVRLLTKDEIASYAPGTCRLC